MLSSSEVLSGAMRIPTQIPRQLEHAKMKPTHVSHSVFWLSYLQAQQQPMVTFGNLCM